MYRKITHLIMIGVSVLQLYNAPYADSLDLWEVDVNGIGQGASSTEVIETFGAPVTVWVPESEVILAASYYDMIYDYLGIKFFFRKNRLEYIEITSDRYSIGNGLSIGSEYIDATYIPIENSDCGVEFTTKNNVIVKIEIYCQE